MKTEWHGDKDTPKGYGNFLIEDDMAVSIRFESFTDYWLILQIIDREVRRIKAVWGNAK